jgi:hypothetical protein
LIVDQFPFSGTGRIDWCKYLSKKALMKYRSSMLIWAILFMNAASAQFSTAKQQTAGGFDVDYMMKMIKTNDGGYITAGTSYSNASGQKSDNSRGGADYWLIKYDRNGNVEWDKTLGGGGDDLLTAILQTSDGGYAAIGTSTSNISGEKTQNSRGGMDWWLVKLDAAGHMKWDKTFGGSGNEYIDYVVQADDGSYVLAGSSDSPISGEKSENSRGLTDYWLVKLDRNGNKTWDKTIGGNSWEWCSPFILSKDGGLIVAGFSASNISGEKTENTRGYSNAYDYWVVKLDQRGRIEWDKTIGGDGDEFCHSLYEARNGEIVIGGSSISNTSGEKTENSRGDFDYWIVRLDKKGTKISDKTIGGNGGDYFSEFKVNAQGDFLIAGSSSSNISGEKTEGNRSGGFGPVDYWLVKMKQCGKVDWDKTIGGFNDDNLVSVIDRGNDEYLLGGSTWSFYSADKTSYPIGAQDFWIVDMKIGNFGIPRINWQKTIGGFSDELIKAEGTQLTSDGGFIIGGSSASDIAFEKTGYNRGNQDYWVVKYDRNGNIQWDKTIGGSDYDELMTIHQTSDGGYILAGNSTSTQSGERSETTRGGFDIWVVKLDKNGNIQWDKTVGGNDNDFVSSIVQTKDGDYLVGGYSASNISGEKSQNSKGGYDMWTIMLSKNGQVKWDKTIGGSDNEFNNYLHLTPDGGYYATGISLSNKSFDKSEDSKGGFDFWVLRFDKFNRIQWDKTLGGNADDYVNGLDVTLDEGLIVGGASLSSISGNKSEYNRGGADYWVVKLDKLGRIQWDKTVGGYADDYANDLVATSDNGVALAGVSFSPIGADKSEYNRNDFDYWVVKIDSKGKVQWDKTFGGLSADLLYNIQELGNDNYLLSGFSSSWASVDKADYQHGGVDIWLINFSMSKEKNHDCGPGFNEPSKMNPDVIPEIDKGTFTVYPIPSTGMFQVWSAERATIYVMDQSGKKILTKNIVGNTQLNLQGLAPGVYYLKNLNSGVLKKIVIAR